MDSLEDIILMLDGTLDTRRKRHIVGGMLMSIALLFGGLAFTTMTIRNDEVNKNE